MALKVKSTKKYLNLPCAHSQWFDTNPDGTPGHCASIHGYDRSVEFTFAGEPDEHGWIVAFGPPLKPVKQFLEYYFDHVTVLPADDPRIPSIASAAEPGGPLQELRILPSGVSMEMSSVFIWEHVNAYVQQLTEGRVYVEKVHVWEHERNSGFVEVDEQTARRSAEQYSHEMLVENPCWEWESPANLLARINS